jgi:hypothetical protein
MRILDGREMVQRIVLAGSGEMLGRTVCARQPTLARVPLTTVSELFDAGISEAACAYAIAVLAGAQANVEDVS